ncbi:MAG: alpha-amylase family glycosyl hydrolase [Verrucomicrobiae bacterium]|nr:alpha-amylase family glycosyl hydrolase [Verrucomicrobiae bacterium]
MKLKQITFLLTIACYSLNLARVYSQEIILQHFGTSWRDIAHRIPELAELGYTALWLPPPFEGTSEWDVGFGTFNRLNLGGNYPGGAEKTRYGTYDDLMHLVNTAHRFGLRVYFDNVMAHNGGPTPGYDENTSIYAQPGFVPEDFHLRVTPDGFYRDWPGIEWHKNDLFQLLHRNPFGRDIAHENPNASFGPTEGSTFPKYIGIRHPNNPADPNSHDFSQYYPDTDLPLVFNTPGGAITVYPFGNKEPYQDVGIDGVAGTNDFGESNGKFDFIDLNNNGQHNSGEPCEPFQDLGVFPNVPGRNTLIYGAGDGRYNMGNPFPEDVNAMLNRKIRWFIDRFYPDGFRLDAVKHVPDYFFGKQTGADKDWSNWGYLGQAQEQFNLTRGFSDWNNHRDTVFNHKQPWDDLFLYGEHLGEPPGYAGYLNAGMRIANDDFLNSINYKLGHHLGGLDSPGFAMYGGVGTGMKYPMSHDNNYLWGGHRELAFTYGILTDGPMIIYTDGYNQSGPPDWFPKPAGVPFLGQFGQQYLPNALSIARDFARGDQIGRWSDQNYTAFERRDKRFNPSMSDADGTVLLFMMARLGSGGQTRPLTTTFPPGSRLRNYSYHGGPFFINVQSNGTLLDDGGNPIFVDGGKYFAFSWASPEMPQVWDDGINSQINPITILQNGQPTPTVTYERFDGKDGDPNFNPRGVPNDTPGDYKYSFTIPRVTNGTNLTFIARADGSAENILIKLNGGVDVNSHMPPLGDPKPDPNNPLKELRDNPPALSNEVFMGFEQMQFVRRTAERFAARNVIRNRVGSPGSETYECIIGTAGFTVNNGSGPNAGAGAWHYHDPIASNENNGIQFSPPPQSAAGQPIIIETKVGYQNQIQKVYLYYTTDGQTYPEGSAGVGKGTTQVIELTKNRNAAHDGTGIPEWWQGTIPALPAGTKLRYKIGALHLDAPSVFPNSASNIAIKKQMETVFHITNFNATTAKYRPHNDYGVQLTGLPEGFNFIQTRAFLKRDHRAPIYRTFTQTFYYDTQRPQGQIVFPANNGDTIGGNSYGFVVRTDQTVTEVWYRIQDSDPNNDDSVTQSNNGNNAWVKAVRRTANPYVNKFTTFPDEWRFDYINIPSSGTATIQVRLKEISSSSNNNLSDVAGHYTTLTRTVNTQGDASKMFVRWPQNDGDTVGQNYVMKVQFSKPLANGLTTAQLIDRFDIKLNGVSQPKSQYSIIYNATNDYHELAFPLPNLYNGDPQYIHQIEVTHARPAPLSTLKANRAVKAAIGAVAAMVDVIDPPNYGANNVPFQIVLPKKSNPTPQERQYIVKIESDATVQSLNIIPTPGQFIGTLTSQGPPTLSGTKKLWTYLWSNINSPGNYSFTVEADTDGNTTTAEGSIFRSVPVVFRELVIANPNDLDDDDDGIYDADESTPKALPTTSSNTWTNGDVHIHFAYGRTNPLSPDSDGDNLPDGLEIGWRTPGAATDINADTDADGYKNFISCQDPPFYNTTDNSSIPGYNANASRTNLIQGRMLDPNNPDSDGDGLIDGLEDANRNGWTDGDGTALLPNQAVSTRIAWPNNIIDISETWIETSPNKSDTDNDGLVDGYGEDDNLNGRTDLFLLYSNNTQKEILLSETTNGPNHVAGANYRHGGATSRGINYSALFAHYSPAGNGSQQSAGWPKILIKETDPLRSDTDGDGLPDGWEVNQALDPLDNGTYNFKTGAAGNPAHGANGDPDNDGFSNMQEYIAGTNPKQANSTTPQPPSGQIVIGPLPPNQQTTVGSVTVAGEFTDWKYDDLIALDPYDGAGNNTQGGDTYLFYDGYDSSRDLVAFYARDGGASGNGGDDQFYFRVDLHDLKPNAEQGFLDIYVLINIGNAGPSGNGEVALPDQLDGLSEMKWNVAVAAYGQNLGRVYVDTNPLNNTNGYQNPLDPPFGVQGRDQNHATGFKKIYYNHELDAVEFSISRQALLDAGWLGNFNQLRFQVFTTKDGTQNNPPGPGDIVGPDIADSIRTDWIANDYRGKGQQHTDYTRGVELSGPNAKLTQWIGIQADNDRGRRVKVMPLIHGNQTIRPASQIHNLINNGAGGGYHRLLDVHEAYNAKLTLHITPTLAAALQWAKVNPQSNKPWLDGPSFNQRIKNLKNSGLISIPATTFSDHILPYFHNAYNQDNLSLANEFLTAIYGAPSNKVFYTPERVVNPDVISKILALGYTHAFIDQMLHITRWYGRNSAVSNDGYRINKINGLHFFIINDQASSYRFLNTDNGSHTLLRELFNRKARNWQQDQVVILHTHWEDFDNANNANAYDRTIRWMASRPWILFVTADQIANNQIDLSIPPNGTGDPFGTVDRPNNPNLPLVSSDYLHYATQENYNNWYNGQPAREEGLLNKVFNIRPGVPLPKAFGIISTSGIIKDAWDKLTAIINPDLKRLSRTTLHAATFVTAFHNQPNVDLTKFSTGDYVNSDTSYNTLAEFARIAHSQARFAAVYQRADTWLTSANNNAYNGIVQTASEDIDLDGEPEYLIMNSRLFLVFERIGGRLVLAITRDPVTGKAYQALGNFASNANSETEEEGATNATAYRTSGLKDWWATPANTSQYVNNYYSVASATGGTGWQFTSSDNRITKNITLAADSTEALVTYNLSNINQLYVRFGLSPHTYNLYIHGQNHLGNLVNTGLSVGLLNTLPNNNVYSYVRHTGPGLNASYVSGASDTAPAVTDTVPMRNQPQIHQVEITGTAPSFTLAFGFQAGSTITLDSDGDGLPDAWEAQYNLDPNNPSGLQGASGDPDGDGLTNIEEFILGLNPSSAHDAAHPIITITHGSGGSMDISFPTLPGRQYRVEFTNSLHSPWAPASNWMNGTGSQMTWNDNGTTTGSLPTTVPRRFYRLQVQLQ